MTPTRQRAEASRTESVIACEKSRRAMSLLEVLVALGILVAGLASVSALMPAAGSRLNEAASADRAGTLAANSHADMANRRMLRADLFPANSTGRALLGGMMPTTIVHPTLQRVVDTALGQYLHVATGFHLKDDLSFPAGGTDPTNAFDEHGLRAYRSAICYGFILVPEPFGATVESGLPARLSVAVFKKVPTAEEISLVPLTTDGSSGVYRLSATGIVSEQLRKRLLAGCSWLLGVGNAGAPPRWLHVAASWTTLVEDANGRFLPEVSYVSLTDAAAGASLVNAGALRVFGFEGLLRVDERVVVLQ